MTLYLSNRDGGKTDEEGHYRWNMNVPVGNVTSGFKVTQNSPLGMSVLIPAGEAKIPYNGYAYAAFQPSGTVTGTITTANGSNPRIDRVVLYIDRAATPQTVNPNNPSIPKVAVVAGTPAATPARPSDATVDTAVSNNPWIDLADVLVGTSVTTISNSNITDTRQVIDRGTGWVPAMESWSYASATTITVPTDATTKYQPGAYIRITQAGTTKYFKIVSLTSTVLTITGAGLYTLTNAIISAPYYSNINNPLGLPGGLSSNLLGYAEITSNFTTTTFSSDVAVTGLSTTVMVPTGARIKILGYAERISASGGLQTVYFSIYESGTLLVRSLQTQHSNGYNSFMSPVRVISPTAGSHTYNLTISQEVGGTITLGATSTSPAFILVETI